MNFQWYYTWNSLMWVWIFLFLISMFGYVLRTKFISFQIKQSGNFIFLKVPLRILTFLCLVVALLGPSFGVGKKNIQILSKDVYFLVDISASMEVKDVLPSRLEKAKYIIKSLLPTLQNDRIALLTFSDNVKVPCPLTFDKSAIELFTQTLKTQPNTTTDIFESVTQASKRIKFNTQANNQLQDQTQNTNTKVLILLSDGESFAQMSNDWEKNWQKNNILTFSVGIGSVAGARVQLTDSTYKYTPQGGFAISKMNPIFLEKIAYLTEGDFFEVSNLKNDFPLLLKAIQNVKGSIVARESLQDLDNKYNYFLWVALFCIILDIVVIVRIFRF